LASKVDIVVGRRDIEGLQLDLAGADYRTVGPSSFGVQTVGAVYFGILVAKNRLLVPGIYRKSSLQLPMAGQLSMPKK
jgi:hypothetical protein